jgi:hypothetical protein
MRYPLQVGTLTLGGFGAANTINREHIMLCRNLIGAVVLVAVAWPAGNAGAWDDTNESRRSCPVRGRTRGSVGKALVTPARATNSTSPLSCRT